MIKMFMVLLTAIINFDVPKRYVIIDQAKNQFAVKSNRVLAKYTNKVIHKSLIEVLNLLPTKMKNYTMNFKAY